MSTRRSIPLWPSFRQRPLAGRHPTRPVPHTSQGKWDQATKLYKKAIGTSEKIVAVSYNDLAKVDNSQGTLEAIPLHKDVIATWETTGGYLRAKGLNNLASIYKAQVRARTCGGAARPCRVVVVLLTVPN